MVDKRELVSALAPLLVKLWSTYAREGLSGRTVTVKVKYADFQQITRSRTMAGAIISPAMIERISFDLLRPLFPPRRGIRLLGVALSHLDAAPDPPARQLALALA